MAIDQDTAAQYLMRHRDKLRSYAWMILRDDHLVEDALQELSVVVIRKCGEIADEAHFCAWCRIATRNISSEIVRARKRCPILLSDSLLDSVDQEWNKLDSTPSADITTALRHCLGRLSDYARQLIDLRYREGLRSAQVAERLGRDVNTIYVALTRTHSKLGECIRRQLKKECADE